MPLKLRHMDTQQKLPFAINHFILGRIKSGFEYTQILNELFDSLDSFIPFDRISVALISGDTITLKWARAKMAIRNLNIGYHASLEQSSLKALALTGKPRIIPDLLQYFKEHPTSESTKKALEDGILSSLTFPLAFEGEVIGFLFFSSCRLKAYKSNHVALLSDIANEMALLINYGRLRDFFNVHSCDTRLLKTTLHELRSPLTIIKGYLELMQSEDWYRVLEDDAKQMFSVMWTTSEAMVSLIKDLEITWWGHGKDELKIEATATGAFLRKADRIGQFLCSSKAIDFRMSHAADLPSTIYLDAGRIEQVLSNLITNAVKFSYPRSRIDLNVSIHDGSLAFTVTDEGQGIRGEEMGLLFKYFGKTSTRPTAGEPSTGLGLAICKDLVERHGGRIEASSEWGKGSTFRFFVPIAREHQLASACSS